eukprot:3045002-Rhodomonas_salina.1
MHKRKSSIACTPVCTPAAARWPTSTLCHTPRQYQTRRQQHAAHQNRHSVAPYATSVGQSQEGRTRVDEIDAVELVVERGVAALSGVERLADPPDPVVGT